MLRFLLIPLLALAGACTTAQVPVTDIFVMRHLNTPGGQRDPDILPEGQAAAQRLPALLASPRIAAIYVTEYRRTRQTAEALAAQLGLTPIPYHPGDTPALIARVRAGPLPALIVGHSNTVPDVVAALGGQRPEPITHDQFGDVWRVAADGTTTRLRL